LARPVYRSGRKPVGRRSSGRRVFLKSELPKNTITITAIKSQIEQNPALSRMPAFAGLRAAIERFESLGAHADAVYARADNIAARMEAAEAKSLAIDATITDYETKRGAIADAAGSTMARQALTACGITAQA
jgi:hypothetical protein